MAPPAPASARARFQSGLLAWLRSPHDPAGLAAMLAAVRETAAESAGGDRVQWRSAETFLKSLLDGSLPVDDESRQLCRRIERQLAAAADVQGDDLATALFAYVSRRGPATDAPTPSALPPALVGALGATADLLPLISGGAPTRFSAAQVHAWRATLQAVDATWQALGRPAHAAADDDGDGDGDGDGSEACRKAATQLLAEALRLNDAAPLQLAEAIATAAEYSDQRAVREHPALRAALAAAIEIGTEPDAPNHPRFAARVAAAVDRLETAILAARRAGRTPAPPGPAAWTVDDAREMLQVMRAALTALPPQAAVLRTGAAWFARQDAIAASIALRGLAVLLDQFLQRVAPVVLDRMRIHQTLAGAVDAMGAALEAIAAGQLPQPDAAAFAELKALLADLPAPRQDP